MYPVEISGPRLAWRELTTGDADALIDMLSDPGLFRYAADQELPDVETYRGFLAEQIEAARTPERHRYKLGITVDGVIAGMGGLEMTSATATAAEIGYLLAPAYWGGGMGTEAASLLVDLAFDRLKLHRVFAGADPANHASIRVLEKIGMRYEGTRREDVFKDGKWRDSVTYAILETDARPAR
ncbi:GNAT family N-acetyltransferase [Phytomonospora endophytica]|uniref:RimJ/RimL family protein N-acetyltransferase n=1 Tax=Phytomonospora endophytica TaxID=714109 RepID=A0A841FR93_9ACTN|nr:GNAT family protein [Phytomonospora endophytica]MBB6037343.1 RimJ/RimL family protein N-acetyltransferase [Phytomonospora endophytica]GIG69914.1 acetyltransferase [Phytomonospora endophytica]